MLTYIFSQCFIFISSKDFTNHCFTNQCSQKVVVERVRDDVFVGCCVSSYMSHSCGSFWGISVREQISGIYILVTAMKSI